MLICMPYCQRVASTSNTTILLQGKGEDGNQVSQNVPSLWMTSEMIQSKRRRRRNLKLIVWLKTLSSLDRLQYYSKQCHICNRQMTKARL